MMFDYKKKSILIQFFVSLPISNLTSSFPIGIFKGDISNMLIFNNYLNFRNNN